MGWPSFYVCDASFDFRCLSGMAERPVGGSGFKFEILLSIDCRCGDGS